MYVVRYYGKITTRDDDVDDTADEHKTFPLGLLRSLTHRTRTLEQLGENSGVLPLLFLEVEETTKTQLSFCSSFKRMCKHRMHRSLNVVTVREARRVVQ